VGTGTLALLRLPGPLHRIGESTDPEALLSRELRGGSKAVATTNVWSNAVAGNASEDDLSALWGRVRDDLEASFPASTFDLWFDPIRAVSLQGATLFLSAAPSVRAWVERRYNERLLEAVGRITPAISAIAFVDPRPAARGGGPHPTSQPLDASHTFERFVIGPGNRLAHAAALAVAELPGEAYNPLYLHGPPGLGKTHLLGAIVEYMERNHPELQIHYTTAERFTTEFVAALRRDGPEAFKARYRELDALLIDDVQVLEGKQHTEEEFVHTFNTLHAAGKQIVLSSDRPPEALERLEERLRDRFDWGLRVELEPPDLRTRIAVLWRLASDSSEVAEPGILQEIAGAVPSNVRALEGAMTRVMAMASLLREPLSPPLVRRALGRPSPEVAAPTSEPPTLEAIQDAVCAVFSVRRSDLLSSSRATKVVRARQMGMYMARELTGMSLAEISRAFKRDHSTVAHSIRAVEDGLQPGSETSLRIHTVHAALGTRPVASGPSTADRHDPEADPA
jgi:chromosomal replication initiator protein